MATIYPVSESNSPSANLGAGLLVLLAAMPPGNPEAVLGNLAAAFPAESLIIASPDVLPTDANHSRRIVTAPASNISWTLTAADFATAYQLAEKHKATAILILGADSGALSSSAFLELANPVLQPETDLAVASYQLSPHAGLVNSAILYPLTRALFSSRVRFPLAVHLGLSIRMAERLAAAGHRFTSLNQGDAPIWPVNEGAVAGFSINQFEVGPLIQPLPTGPDLSTILPLVVGSLFSDIDAKAAFWQRPRQLPPPRDPTPPPRPSSNEEAAEIIPMIHAFQLAYKNLYEIWSLVLPPNSLLGLKRLSVMDATVFRMPDSLWARIVFDFLLAHRLRTINRGHLLGALIPLYLAWVASHFTVSASGTEPERHIEAVAAAFEADKAYLVSRWRWPDRFNP